MEVQITNQPTELQVGANTATKNDLLRRAKDAIDAGEQSLRDGAAALGVAQELHSVSQREMAAAVRKSVGWVNALLKWRRSGYQAGSPFGPTTKAGRVQHAEQQVKENEPKEAPAKPRSAVTPKDEASVDFSVRVMDLIRRTTKRNPERFAATSVPTSDLAKLGKFLIDLADLKKSRAVRSPLVTRSGGNSVVSPEQSAEDMKAQHAALDTAEIPVAA